MPEDREILRKVWEGRVAARITLAEEDVSTLGQPDPHYLMLPRLSYFPVVLDKVRKSFQRFITPELKENEVWLEFEGTALKLQYPIGVLYDLHNRECESPWHITLHFSDRPTTLVSLPCRDSMESQFVSSLKEADALKHNCSVMNSLQGRDQKQLWLSLISDKFDQFWSVNQKLMDCKGGSSTAAFRYVPFKVHFNTPDPNNPPGSGGPVCVRASVMRLCKPVTESAQPVLLQHLVEDTLQDVLQPDDVLLVQGVTPPLDTPLLWLSQHLSYADNFLHFSVRRPVR